MNRKLIAAFAFIVLLPLALLVWVGRREAGAQRERVDAALRELLTARLADISADIARRIDERRRLLLDLTSRPEDSPDFFRDAARSHSAISSFFLLDPEGELLFPPSDRPASAAEAAFLRRTEWLWRDKQFPLLAAGADPSTPAAQAGQGPLDRSSARSSTPPAQAPANADSSSGWYAWHWDLGLHLLFWRSLPDGRIVGAELDRSGLLADLIGLLPDSPASDGANRIALLDADRRVIYQWGDYTPADGESPLATLPLEPPLAAWSLAIYGPPPLPSAGFAADALPFWTGLAALALAVVGLGVYVYRESSRELREAAQRVSFVGQVSHELKTPLTNIRMYAELLERELDEDDSEARRDLGVIVSESGRLSRLIANILTFSRRDRDTLRLRPLPGDLDAVLRGVAEQFRPLLSAKGVRIELDLGAPGEVPFDRDAVEQILANLIGNVEKYAASGGLLRLSSRREGSRSTVTVADAGPGVPPAERAKIFLPFYRVSDRLTDGVAGTGIGLALARDLARLHGGDLVLLPSERGACFQLTLEHPLQERAHAS